MNLNSKVHSFWDTVHASLASDTDWGDCSVCCPAPSVGCIFDLSYVLMLLILVYSVVETGS